MPPHTYDSDDSEGGAPLYPSAVTPVGRATSRHGDVMAKSDSPSDEEKALVRASVNFGSLKDPFAETPGVPQSVPANNFSHRPPLPQPTPSRVNPGFTRFGPPQSANNNNNHSNRFRASTAVIGSGSAPRLRSGTTGVGFGNNHGYGNEDPQACQQTFSCIMTATQYINVSPGIPTQTQIQLTQILQEISQGFSTAIVQWRKQRDDACREREDEHERYKRAAQEAHDLRKTTERLQSVNNTLGPQIDVLAGREKMLKDQIRDLEQQLRISRKHFETLTADAMRFHAHHDKVIKDYKEQDEKHFKAMAELENEVKALRSNNTTDAAAMLTTPIPPASVNNVADGECDSNSPIEQPVRGASLVPSKTGEEQARHHGQKPDNFVPNPQAPEWAPNKNQQQPQVEDSSSAHSGDVVVYTGHSHPSKMTSSMTTVTTPHARPATAAPGSGGAFIRTPFGVVFGEYPTVEENAKLPGDKMIPRDKEEWEAVDVQRALAHLYDLCKGYVANCHMRGPPNVPFDCLAETEPYTWHYLMQQVYKDPENAANHLTYLLGAKAFVPYLLQRTCVDYLLKKILTPQVFLGYSDQMDGHLRALQGQLANIADNQSRPNQIRSRQRVIEDHAKLIRLIAGAKEVSEFRRRTVDRHASIMSALLEPCRARSSSNNKTEGVVSSSTADMAHKSLRIMVAACWDISIKVWGSGKTLHYVFPECATKFSPGTMEALNGHHMAASPADLLHAQCRVSLVVTPTMTLRDDRDAARMQCHAIHKSQVLLMK